ncbi:MAG: cytochrome c3 family protein [Planctomycetota bacterium]
MSPILASSLLPVMGAIVALAPLLSSAAGSQQGQARAPPLKRQGAFVNDREICGDCHEEEFERIGRSLHARVPELRWLKACETCHGPGEAHVQQEEPSLITHPAKLSAQAQTALCAGCHRDQIQEHGGPLADLLVAGRKCSNCHRIHEELEAIPGARIHTLFTDRKSMEGKAKPSGMAKCLGCHGSKRLEGGPHEALLGGKKSWPREQSCESCHGPGSLHIQSRGLARLISRPDRAADGMVTCRSCHGQVDPERFHWSEEENPLLGAAPGATLSCTTCHRVHSREDPTLHAAPDPLREPEKDSCIRCHTPAYRVLRGTVHESLARLGRPGPGCTACHEGGEAHAAHGGDPRLVRSMRGTTAEIQVRTCNRCHGGKREVCGFGHGVHGRSGIGCLSCHSPAAPAGEYSWKQDAESRCGNCHARVALSFRHANRHPVGEGGFGCSSCHDPHLWPKGGPDLARRMSREACLSCHREYRGPHVFPHHADKGRGCLACHLPHGSGNRKLLVARTARDTCLACHADLPSFHDQSPGSVYRNCMSCHIRIHGSNRHRFFFK